MFKDSRPKYQNASEAAVQKTQLRWKGVARKFDFVYLCFDSLRWKQLNSLTSIDMFNCLGDPEVKHH